MKAELKRFSWVNWSELARIEILKEANRQKAFEEVEKILKKSKLTEENAQELADETSRALAKRYKKMLEKN
jgi:cytochrome c553